MARLRTVRITRKLAAAIADEVATNYSSDQTRADEDAIIARAFAIIDGRMHRGEALADPAGAGAYFARHLRHLPHEVFAMLFLDTRHRVIAYEELFSGTIDGCEVHPREVARRCLQHNAAAVILGHNHPSGNPEPSAADRALTARLKSALALVEVRVLDHFVVGDGTPTSMAMRGWV
jgi:DNA repair protein RadC